MSESLLTLFRTCPAIPAAVILAVEAIKAILLKWAFQRSADGNVMGPLLTLEGATFVADAAVICRVAFPYAPVNAPALFTACATFLIARVASSLFLSRTLHK